MQELVIAVAELFGLTDEDIYQAIINREEDMKHICDIYRLKNCKLNLRNLNEQ